MRQLATIRMITDILPIEGKDRIGLALVDGWQVIVQKDQFTVGGLCVYCEIDSVLPDKPEFDFLRSKNFRIKTMKMAGVISQGICFPLSVLPKGKYDVGDDVTDVIGVTKYEPYVDDVNNDAVKAKHYKHIKALMRFKWYRQYVYKKDHRAGKGFPSFIPKTDETRVQNIPSVLMNKAPWIVTEKIDGQSGTFALVRKKRLFKDKFEYIVCSRNLRLFNRSNASYWRVSDKYKMLNKLIEMIGDNEWVAVQGECIAPTVQGNKYKVEDADFYAFNVIYPNGRMDSLSAKKLCTAVGLKFVPIIADDYVLPDTIDELLEYAHGDSAIGKTLREGLVLRSPDGKNSFKAVDPKFLLKYDE